MHVRRSLWPREHGAYAQLGVPIATALALHAPSMASIALAAAACLAFLANEPLLVVLGHRGARRRELDGRRATRRLIGLVLGGFVAEAVGLRLAPYEAVVLAGVAAIPALAMVRLAWTRSEHSLGGELLAAIALPGASAPLAVASGTSSQTAGWLWAAWSVGYAASVLGVHRVLARNRHGRSWRDAGLVVGVAIVILGICGIAPRVPVVLVGVPLLSSGALLALRPPRARHLRMVGVALVVASVLSAVIGVTVAQSVRERSSTSAARHVNVL
jgi:hypothetical protein